MYNKYFCQNCGHDTKLVETAIDDRYCVNEDGTGEYMGFADGHEHTGIVRCEKCLELWTGDTTNE